jgi:multidrug resistance efflux pump
MLELILCGLVTVFPDYLYRRYAQGKRFGQELTIYSVWHELRWGITSWLMLTVLLISVIFYFHPASNAATLAFRTVPILPQNPGRVAEVHVAFDDRVEAGQPIFSLDDAAERAAVETAARRLAEIDAEADLAEADLAQADGRIAEAEGALAQAEHELQTKLELRARNTDVVATREIERLQDLVAGRQGALDAAKAAKRSVESRIATQIPAQRASAEAALAEAQVQLDRMVVRAGVTGTVEQFTLREGDFVSILGRPAGVLIPEDAGRQRLAAAFGQIEAQVVRPGMVGEAACISQPFTIVPLVVTDVQQAIAGGQLSLSDQLLDVGPQSVPGTITVLLEPLHDGAFDRLPPGSNCLVNIYSSHHHALESGEATGLRAAALHVVDTVAVVHAGGLRLRAAMMPLQALVFSGGH